MHKISGCITKENNFRNNKNVNLFISKRYVLTKRYYIQSTHNLNDCTLQSGTTLSPFSASYHGKTYSSEKAEKNELLFMIIIDHQWRWF